MQGGSGRLHAGVAGTPQGGKVVTAPIALPGTLRDLLAVGMSVTEHTDWLHDEFDPEVVALYM